MSNFPPQSAVSVRQTTVKLDLKVAISSYISLRGRGCKEDEGGSGRKITNAELIQKSLKKVKQNWKKC
jgi:hypothetical protein